MPCARPLQTSTESSVGSPITRGAPSASVGGCNFAGQASRSYDGASDDGGDRPQIITETFIRRSRSWSAVAAASAFPEVSLCRFSVGLNCELRLDGGSCCDRTPWRAASSPRRWSRFVGVSAVGTRIAFTNGTRHSKISSYLFKEHVKAA